MMVERCACWWTVAVLLPVVSLAQEKIVVTLHLRSDITTVGGLGIDFGRDGTGRARLQIAEPGGSRSGVAPGGVRVLAERVGEPDGAYFLRVDTDGDGEVATEKPTLMTPGSSITLEVARKDPAPGSRTLSYVIRYFRSKNSRDEVVESFFWFSNYRAEGKLRVDGCDSMLVLTDLNGDGVFDVRDFKSGTSLGLDRNNDGRIQGREEWLNGSQIIELCGRGFLVDHLREDGSAITFVPATARVPKIGEPAPSFSLTLTDGKVIRSEELRNKIVVLDFWASWCRPCVEKFPTLQQIAKGFGDELVVIAINVDEAARIADARRIIDRYQLTWPHVMSGRGDADPFWKQFGGMNNNQLSIPLYVVIEPRGILRYADHGGENLGALRASIQEARKAPR